MLSRGSLGRLLPIGSPRKRNGKDKFVVEEDTSPVESLKLDSRLCVQKYMAAINRHADKKELLSFYLNDQVKITFSEGLEVTAKSSCGFFQSMFKSFPDVQWKYQKVEEMADGRILVKEVRAAGTHTGEPFSFVKPVATPKSALFLFQDYPPLPASGKSFENDPASFIFRVVDNKIVEVEVVALGLKTGPLGIYEDLTRG